MKDSFLAPDDPLALETKTRFSQRIKAIQNQYGPLDADEFYQYMDLLYPYIQLSLCMKHQEDILYTNAKTHIYMQRGLI